MKKFIFTLGLLATLSTSLFAETLLSIGERTRSDIDNMPSNQINDTLVIEQDPTEFSQQADPMSAMEQLDYDDAYNEKFFEPWHISDMNLLEGEKIWQFMFAKRKMYRRFGERIPKSWFKTKIKDSNFDNYNNLAKPAITIKHTNLKLYPTNKEFYYNTTRTGEGFPFDYNQNSSIHMNTPLFASHYSLDKRWIYVKTAFAFGWIEVESMAFITPEFQEAFENNQYHITTTDNLNLTEDETTLSLVKMGTIFPQDELTNEYIFAGKDENGYTTIKRAKVNEVNIIARKPIKFNAFNIAYIGKQLVGEPYGWGGKLETRDCSTLTRDFFAPFGIYLPRNSRQQAKSGEYISLKGLSIEEKQQSILENAKSCRSLLFLPGHIMLYLGEKDNEPVIMHNYWGVRLKNGKKHIMGRAIISTTKPGAERPDIKKKSMLINTIKGVVNF